MHLEILTLEYNYGDLSAAFSATTLPEFLPANLPYSRTKYHRANHTFSASLTCKPHGRHCVYPCNGQTCDAMTVLVPSHVLLISASHVSLFNSMPVLCSYGAPLAFVITLLVAKESIQSYPDSPTQPSFDMAFHAHGYLQNLSHFFWASGHCL